jgi:hypothetical protein
MIRPIAGDDTLTDDERAALVALFAVYSRKVEPSLQKVDGVNVLEVTWSGDPLWEGHEYDILSWIEEWSAQRA